GQGGGQKRGDARAAFEDGACFGGGPAQGKAVLAGKVNQSGEAYECVLLDFLALGRPENGFLDFSRFVANQWNDSVAEAFQVRDYQGAEQSGRAGHGNESGGGCWRRLCHG